MIYLSYFFSYIKNEEFNAPHFYSIMVQISKNLLISLYGIPSSLINTIPQPVLGGVGIVMFGTIAAAGIKALSTVHINNRNLLIIAASVGLGLGVTFRPDFVSNLPQGLNMIFSSGISTGTITALILNNILKEEK